MGRNMEIHNLYYSFFVTLYIEQLRKPVENVYSSVMYSTEYKNIIRNTTKKLTKPKANSSPIHKPQIGHVFIHILCYTMHSTISKTTQKVFVFVL